MFLPVYLHANVGLPSPPAASLPHTLLPQLPISAPPTSLDECFFFNSLVVRLPYALIFCQFWLFFVFKFVVVLVLVVRGGTACLPISPSWPEVLSFSALNWTFFYSLLFCIQWSKYCFLHFCVLSFFICLVVLFMSVRTYNIYILIYLSTCFALFCFPS